MSKKDSLGDRMKTYEAASKMSLPMRMPVIIRIDGKAFHSYTRGCDRPFDIKLTNAMDVVAQRLCEEVQGCQVAYCQSDEISLLLHNYKKINSSAWFDNSLQKIVSVSASIAAAVMTEESFKVFGKIKKAVFDSRAFVIPESDVVNAFIWRQQDATRNSIQMLAQSLYSHKELHGKNQSQLQEMCWQKGHNWNDTETRFKRGRCIIRGEVQHDDGTIRKPWIVDNEIPIFTQDREYINNLLAVDDD